jgi:DHA2 family multidrug resistance protein-like MFS transporter
MRMPAARPTADPNPGFSRPRGAVAIGCVLAALVLVVLDAAIANVALPTIARSLRVTPAQSVWVVTAYQIALVMALLPCGALGESLGYRRVFTAGVAIFTGASALCAFSPTLPWLVVARFVQGLGGAAVMSLALALVRFVVPHERVGAAIGWNALTVALTSAAGPTIGALILSRMGWPWLFAVNLPVGLVALIATRALPDVAGSARPLDAISVALNAGMFAALVVGAELLPKQPMAAVVLLGASVVCMIALARREAPRAAPLIPLDLLRSHSFRVSVMASVCCFAGQTLGMVALPFYLQHGLGQSTFMTGLYITPWPLSVAAIAPITGRLSDRVPGAWLCALGGAALAVGLAGLSLWPSRAGPAPLMPFIVLCGLGFGLFQAPNNRNMLLSAPRERSGAAGGMQGTARLAGQTMGAVMMTLLFTLTSLEAAPRIGLAIGAALSLAAGLVSTLRARPPASIKLVDA